MNPTPPRTAWHLQLLSFQQQKPQQRQKPQQKQRKLAPATPPLTARQLANARLLKAAAEGDVLGVRLALEAGADVNAARDKQRGRTALMLAIRGGDSDNTSTVDMQEMESEWKREGERMGEALAGEVPAVVATLLRAGAQVNLSDAVGGTALHYAVVSGNAGVCRELLWRGANVNAGATVGVTPLAMAVIGPDPAMVDLLLRAGANAKERRLPGRPPLLLLALHHEPQKKEGGEGGLSSALRSMMGAMIGGSGEDALREEVVDLLLAAGLDPGETAQQGWTALAVAASVGSPRIVRRIIGKGAKVDAALDNGSTPLALAAWAGRADNVRVFLEAGANPSAADKDGDTPLMLAAEKGSYAATEFLLKAGAKAESRNNKGRSARDVAASLRHTAIVHLLDTQVSSGKPQR